MILVDDRIGSADLISYLRFLHAPCELTRLEYGDVCFAGNGPDGPLTIACGIEIKKVHDALACMSDGRFAGHQLPGLVQTYDRVWLVVEGLYRADFHTGLLLRPGDDARELTMGSRRFMYRDLDHWLATMEEMGAIRIRRTGDRTETARVVADLHSWWTAKDYTEHTSHRQLFGKARRPDRELFQKPTLCRMVAAELPGIGWAKSQDVVKRFKNVVTMVGANAKEWAEVPGVGKVMAQRIYDALRK